MIIVTGGAGFIGSNLAAAPEERGGPDLVVCDRLGRGGEWRHLAKRALEPDGWSKHLLDRRGAGLVERGSTRPPQWIGCKFFNVYGPNEYHKGDMRSVVTQFFPLAKQGKPAPLFRSYRPDVPDGGQKRDLVYVRVCADIPLGCYDPPRVNRLFNVCSRPAPRLRDL